MKADPDRARRLWSIALALLPYLLLLGAAYSVFAFSEDDPYITFRYAANLLAGHGPVFNVGEHVEGDTSALHMLACAALLRLAPPVDILFKAKLFSLLMALTTVALTRPLGRQAGLTETEARLAQVLVALNVNFALAAVNALETTLYAALTLAALIAFIRECRAQEGWGSAGLLFLAWLTRPEAVLLFPALLAVRLFWARRHGAPLAFALPWAAAFLLLATALLCGRHVYYGQWLPNTYYAKHVGLKAGLAGGARYLLHPLLPVMYHFLVSKHAQSTDAAPVAYSRWSLLTALLFWGLALAGAARMRRDIGGLALMAAVAAALAFTLRSGGDWMHGWRFMVSSLPLLAVLQSRATRLLPPRPAAGILGAMTVLWGLPCLLASHDSWAAARFSTRGADLLAAGGNPLGPLWVESGALIRRRFAPGVTIAYSEMGYACYVNLDKKFLDLRGLTDAEVAHLPQPYRTQAGFTDYHWYLPGDPLYDILRRRRPDAVVTIDPYPGPRVVLGDYRLADLPGEVSWHAPRAGSILFFVRAPAVPRR